jgi:predicted amidohydrolase
MPTIRIAVASTPLLTNLAEAVPAAIAAVEEAGRQGAAIVCLPETVLPGHRMQRRPVEDATQDALAAALRDVAAAAARARVVTLVGTERPTPTGREIVQVVIDADGKTLGEQRKTQMDPSASRSATRCSGTRRSRARSRSAAPRSSSRRTT